MMKVTNMVAMDGTFYYYYDRQPPIEIRNGSEQVLKQQVFDAPAPGGSSYVDELVQIAINQDPKNMDDDGDVDATGYSLYSNYSGPMGHEIYGDPSVMHPKYRSFRNMDGYGNTQATALCEFGHQGLMHDEEFMVTGQAGSQLIYNRARTLHPGLGRFMQRDPLGYVDGMGLYQYVRNAPIHHTDSYGTQTYRVKKVYGADFLDTVRSGHLRSLIPGYFFFHRGQATYLPFSEILYLESFVFSKRYYVFWLRWGTARAEVNIHIRCDENGVPFADPKGNSQQTVSISSALVKWTEDVEDKILTIEAVSSGAISAGGGPNVSYDGLGLSIGISWPDARDSNTFQMGKFKFKCVCD